MKLSTGTLFKERYLLESKLGEGGMGEVWQAVDQQKRLRVAVKVATAGGRRAREATARFRRECYIGDLLGQEAGFIRVLDFDAAEPIWMVMDLVEGAMPLGRGPRGPVRERDALVDVVRQLRDAANLARRAHALGVVHRDIKPSNILVDARGSVFLADFGLAKHGGLLVEPVEGAEPEHETKTGTGFGTFVFMAPEQAKDAKSVGPAADIFSLAATLFTVLAGSPPYGSSESEVIENHHDARHGRFAVTSLIDELPWLLPELDHVCREALSVDPGKRPTATVFVDTLTRALAGLNNAAKPVVAPHPMPVGALADLPHRAQPVQSSQGSDPSAVFANAEDDHLATDALFAGNTDDSVNEFFPAGSYTLYPWQAEALAAWERTGRRGIIEAVTGAGKSLVGVEAVRRHFATGGSAAVVVVPTRPLVEQWAKNFANLAPKLRVGRFFGGTKDTFRSSDVIVATIQSLPGLAVPAGALLIADECHHYGGVELIWDPKLRREVASPGVWTRAILSLPAKNRLGLTATVERTDGGHDTALVDAVGPSVFTLSYARALAERVVAPFKIAFVRCEFGDPALEAEYHTLDRRLGKLRKVLVDGYRCSPDRFGQFLKDVQALAKGPSRDGQREAGEYLNKFARRREILAEVTTKYDVIRKLVPCVEGADKALLFTESRAGGARSFAILDAAGVAVGYIDGTVGDKSQLLSMFGRTVGKAGALKAIVSPKVLDEGVDVPAADLGIVVAASSSRRQMVQRLGRVIRRKADGRRARLAVLVVKDTNEDPQSGAHEDFINEVLDVLGRENWRCFEAAEHGSFVPWLNDFAAVVPAPGRPAEVKPDAPPLAVGDLTGLSPNELLQMTRAALVKEVVRRLVPAHLLSDIPGSDGKGHYIDRLCKHYTNTDALLRLLLQQPDLMAHLHGPVPVEAASPRKDDAGAPAEPAQSGAEEELKTPRTVLAELLVANFSRGEMVEFAARGGVEGVTARHTATKISGAVAGLGSALCESMSLDQIRRLARAVNAPVAGTKVEVFACAAAAIAGRSDQIEDLMPVVLTAGFTKDQLLSAGQRLGDEVIRSNLNKLTIAEELVQYEEAGWIDAFTVVDLRELLGIWDLPKGGSKAELVARVALDLIDRAWEVGP